MIEFDRRLQRVLRPQYRLIRRVRQGEASTVYVAADDKLRRFVAVKVLCNRLASSTATYRFRREIDIASRLQHPNILPMYDFGEFDGLPFYIMPFVEGDSLRDKLRRERTLPIAEALAIGGAVGCALDYAHRRRVVHRDVKPENILLYEGNAVVTDFGIAVPMEAQGNQWRTQEGLTPGTPEYMSPEHAAGERTLDGRSDVYSLGCIIYEMIAGAPPFTGRPRAVMSRQITTRPAPLADRAPATPAHVSAAVARALEKSPDARFATAGTFVSALGANARVLRPTPKTIAVLPFTTVRDGSAICAFDTHITAELVKALERASGVEVAMRHAVGVLKGDIHVGEMGRRLRAELLLLGMVIESKETVRVTAQLINTGDGSRPWSKPYDRQWDSGSGAGVRAARDVASLVEQTMLPTTTPIIRAG